MRWRVGRPGCGQGAQRLYESGLQVGTSLQEEGRAPHGLRSREADRKATDQGQEDEGGDTRVDEERPTGV